MSFLNPTAFWGLLALIIPTIVLLMSKQKQQIVEFGSLAFLETSESKTARKIFPTEWLLYFLRVAIIALVVLLLAEPVRVSEESAKKILIEKQVYDDPDFAGILEDLGDDVEIVEPQSLALLIRKLNEKADSVVVYSRSYAKNFKGSHQALGKHIEWKTVPVGEDFQYQDTLKWGANLLALTVSSGEDGLKWKADPIQSSQPIKSDSISVRVHSSSDRSVEKAQLEAIFKAYESVIPVTFDFEKEEAMWTILIDTIISAPYKNLISWNNFEGRMQLNCLYAEVFEINGSLKNKELSTSNFPLALAHTLLQEHFGMEDMDRRLHVPAQSSASVQVLKADVPKEKIKYWWIVILLLVLIERWMNRKLPAE